MELAAAAEGCVILGVGRARWYQLIHEPGFPAPVAVLSCGAIYDADELREVARRRAARRQATAAKKAAGPTGGRQPVPGLPAGLTLP